MGWWDEGILGGDTPLDILGDIAETLKVPNDDAMNGKVDPKDYDGYMLYPLCNISDEHAKRLAKSFKDNKTKIDKIIKVYGESNHFEIVTQVVAVFIMASGASFPKGFRSKAVTAGENDEWAKEDETRANRIAEYIKAVKDYKVGNRIILSDRGLFQKMEEKLGNNKETIVELKNGCSLRSSDKNYIAGDYVRLCDPTGKEIKYWDHKEWQEEPVLVIGAIISAAAQSHVFV